MATLNLATTWCEGSSGWGGTDSFKPLGWQHPCSTEFWSKRTSNLAEAPTSRAPEPYPHEPLASHRFPPLHTRCTGDLSGRPFCRIYFRFSRQVCVNAGEILQWISGEKVQHGRKQKGPRYRGPFCLSRFILEWVRPVAARPWRGVIGVWSGRA